jgi:Zn-dependent protease
VENFDTEEQPADPQPGVLPKPVLIQDKQNWIRKSLISLLIYGFLFFAVFRLDVIYIAAVLVVLLIHEFGHFFAMKAFNYTNVKLFILPLLGAYVTGKKAVISQRQMTVVILAGPVPGIIIGFIILMYNASHPNEKLEMLGNIFLYLNAINLLPFIPLDGGRLLETLFVNQNHILRLVFSVISIMATLLLAIFSQSIILLVIPASLIFDMIMEIKNHRIREYLKQEKINYIIDYNDLPDQHYWIIRDGILLSFNKRYTGIRAGLHQYSAVEGGLIQHVIAVLKTPFIKDISIFGKILVVILYIVFFIVLPVIALMATKLHL